MSLTKGLVLHCPLDQESYNTPTLRFIDRTGFANHGTACNTAVFSTDHNDFANRSCTFNGTTDCVDCGNDTSFNVTEAITIATWFYPLTFGEGTTNDRARIVCKIPSIYVFYLGENGQMHFWGGSSGAYAASDYYAVTLNTWNLVVVTYDRQNIKFYSNNNYYGGAAQTAAITTSTQNLLIGNRAAYDRTFDGHMEDVRIYNRALSTDEISRLYHSYRPRFII